MRTRWRIPEPLAPEAAARLVVEEVELLSCQPLPGARDHSIRLAQRAHTTAAANARFRKLLAGARGRDWLHAFMRHWLAAELRRHHPAFFRALPPRYAVGEVPRLSPRY